MDEITCITIDAYTGRRFCDICGGAIGNDDLEYCPCCGREIGERFDPETEA